MILPSAAECRASLRGFAAALRGDPKAAGFYDLSVDGFWRSFVPNLLLIIPYALLLQPLADMPDSAVSGTGALLQQLVLQIVTWIAYLLLMVIYCRAFGLTARYSVFVILYNWAQAVVLAATLPVLALTAGGLLPAGTALGWSAMLLLLWLYAVTRIAQISLGAGLGAALVAAILDPAVTLLLHRLVDLIL